MDNPIRSNHFSLRKFEENKDEAPLFEALSEPAVVRHMATSGFTEKDCSEIVQGSIIHWSTYKIGSWAVEVDSKVVGWAGFKHWTNSEFELLIVLAPEYWGLGKEIYKLLVRLAEEKFKLKSIIVLLPNTRKTYKYIIERAGFRHIGEEKFNEETFQKFELSFV